MTGNVLAIIGGTGAEPPEGFVQRDLNTITTPFGESGPIAFGALNERQCLFMQRHGDGHTVAPHRINYRANLWALSQCAATHVLALNTVGGIHAEATPGSLWLVDDLIDYTWGREQSCYDGTVNKLRHQECARPYCDLMRRAVLSAARDAGLTLHDGGVYGCTQGPRLETAAEIRRMRNDGCDVVGMTGMPEGVLAAELGLRYASLCMVVNPAAGLSAEPISLEQIMQEAAGCMIKVQQLVARLKV